MSCGGSKRENANAAVISDTVKAVNTTLSTPQADEEFADPIGYDFSISEQGTQWGDLLAYSPEQFAGLCEAINGSFAEYLYRQGDTSVVLQDYAALGTGDAPEGYPHTVAVLDGYVYDFTYRQVAPTAPIPFIIEQDAWEAHWRPVDQPRDADGLGFDDDPDDEFNWSL